MENGTKDCPVHSPQTGVDGEKMAMRGVIGAVLVLLAMAGPASAQEAWSGVKWGATETDVTMAHPNVTNGSGDAIGSGAGAALPRLVITDHEVLGRRFYVRFYFRQGRLNYISFEPVDDAKTDPILFAELVAALTGRFGQPAMRYSGDGRDLVTDRISWGGDGTFAMLQRRKETPSQKPVTSLYYGSARGNGL